MSSGEGQLKTGQVAKLFGLSVQTLHFYDRIGLFSPQVRDPSTGYRYYMYSQMYQLANIVFLRKQNYSITEIIGYLTRLSVEERMADLVKQSHVIDAEVLRYQFISNALKERLKFIENSDYLTLGNAIEVADMPRVEYFEIGVENSLFPSEAYYFFPTILFYTADSMTFGVYIQEKASFFSYASIFSEVSSVEAGLQSIAAGKVLRAFYVGSYQKIRPRIEEIRDYAAKKGLKLADYSIHFNIVDQFIEKDAEQFVTEIKIPILA